MIVKRMPNTSKQKSKLAHISDLYNYICGLKDLDHHVVSITTFNLNKENTHEANIADLYDLAASSARSANPIEHWVLSLAKGDSFDGKESEVITMFLHGLGYDDCLCVAARHGGTGNDHIHLEICRVDPVTHKCRSDSFSKEKAHRASALISHTFGFQVEPKARYKVDNNEIVRVEYPEEPNEIRISDSVRAQELRTGEKSMQRVSAETILPLLLKARTWDEVHEHLAAQGCVYVKKGGGAVIRATVDGKTVDVKPSSIHKQASLKNMEKRLGAYAEPDKTIVVSERKAEPLNGIPQAVFDAYKADQKAVQPDKDDYADFRAEMERLRAEKQRMIEAVQAQGWKGHGAELAAFLHAIKEHSDEETAFLLKRYQDKIAKGKPTKDRATPFDVWIRHQPRADAVLEALDASQAVVKIDATIAEHTLQTKTDAFALYHQAVGADRYRVTVGTEDKKTTLEKLEMYEECEMLNKPFDINEYKSKAIGYTPDVLTTKFQRLTRHEIKRNEHVYLTPLSDNKYHILVDDVSKDQIIKMKSLGLRPSCILESSPNNYQLIFTLPKIGIEHEKKIVDDLATGLNDTFGDVNCCGTSHAHRCPGFYNVKPKYKREDNTYPTVRVVEAHGGSCPVLSRYIADIADYYANQDKQDKQRVEATERNQQAPIDVHTTQEQVGLFNMHRDHILRISRFPVADESRIDFMVALRLRATGHREPEIASMIAARRQDKQNPIDYGQRTAHAVFGAGGDAKLAELAAYVNQWRILEENYANTWAITKQRQIQQSQQRHLREEEAEEREAKARKEKKDRKIAENNNDYMPRM